MHVWANSWTSYALLTVGSVFFLTAGPIQSSCPLDGSTVATDKGCLRGESQSVVTVFRGIPYAAPPVGSLRWQAPQEHAPWEGVRKALQFGKSCPQLADRIFRSQVQTDEDCLFLNIWTPRVDSQGNFPVMFWIHGGGLLQGSSSQTIDNHLSYDGQFLAEKGSVVVSINYRLGQLGFLAHPALSAEDKQHNISGNYGLLDQIAALRWVQTNISNFGGNPMNVTIFGESAGGKSVCALLASPLAAGLFHRAIIQSGGCPMNQQNLRGTPESAEAQGERFTRAVGCADNPDILECLRSKTVQEILNTLPAEVNILTRIEKYDFSVDGYTLLSSPGHALESGKFNSVPMIAGTTGNEASLFTSALNIKTSAQYEAYVRSIFGRLAGQVLARYPASEYANARSVLDALISDFSFVCPTRWLTRAVQEHQ